MKLKCFVLIIVIIISVNMTGCTEHGTPSDFNPKDLEHCLESATTDLIDGICVSCSDLGNYIYYQFKPVNSYFSFCTHDVNYNNIYHVMVSKKSYDKTGQVIDPVSFNFGETYLLLLFKAEMVYQPFDVCVLASNYLYFDNESIEKSTMYGKPLTEFSDIDTIESKDMLVSYMVDKLKERFVQYNVEYKYTTSEDLPYILDFCNYVLTVKVKKRVCDSSQESCFCDYFYCFDQVGEYACEIVSALKAEKGLPSQIYVAFKDNEVKVGETYIVCLKCYDIHDDGTNRYKVYLFGSKVNMFDICMQETFSEILEAN